MKNFYNVGVIINTMSYTHKFNNKAKQQANRRKEENVNSNSEESEEHKIYITVPYEDKSNCKLLGGRWDDEFKSWYVLRNFENYETLVKRYPYVERVYLFVPYELKDKAKSMGAYFCGVKKQWYAPKPNEQKDLINTFGSVPKIKRIESTQLKKPITMKTGKNIVPLVEPSTPNEVEIIV